MKRNALRVSLFAFSMAVGSPVSAIGGNAAPAISPAVDGIFSAFKTHPLVGIADQHGLAQELDFYAAVVRDPRFAANVGNVVVEFGGAAHQDVIDRYVAGKPVPYRELRKVWTDVVGWLPTVTGLGYLNFFAQVRETNANLPPSRRIRVWLGEPGIDWAKIRTRQDWMRIAGFRDRYPAELIEQRILSKHKKALVIYGGGHYGPPSETQKELEDDASAMTKRLGVPQPLQLGLQTLVEQKYPKAFFIVTAYAGYTSKACSSAVEKTFSNWKNPTLATPVRGTVLETAINRPGCYVTPRGLITPQPNRTVTEQERILANNEAKISGLTGDALLYLGPAHQLTQSPANPDFYLDPEYRLEVGRHAEILTGSPLGPAKIEDFPVSPKPWKP